MNSCPCSLMSHFDTVLHISSQPPSSVQCIPPSCIHNRFMFLVFANACTSRKARFAVSPIIFKHYPLNQYSMTSCVRYLDKWNYHSKSLPYIALMLLGHILRINVMTNVYSGRMNFSIELLKWYLYIDGLVQDCSISIANALEIQQSCTKSPICTSVEHFHQVVLPFIETVWFLEGR